MIRRIGGAAARTLLVLAIGGIGVFGVTPLSAQQAGPSRGQMDRAQLERRILAQFAQLVQTELGLDSAATAGLFVVVEEFGDERRALQVREAALNRRLRGTGVYLSEEQSAAALQEFVEIKREELALLEAEHARLTEVLPAPQLLRFYTLREQMGERIRRLRGEGPRGEGPGREFSNHEFPDPPER